MGHRARRAVWVLLSRLWQSGPPKPRTAGDASSRGLRAGVWLCEQLPVPTSSD